MASNSLDLVRQRFIAWLLHKYTPFRVIAWNGNKIGGIGVPQPRNEHFYRGDGVEEHIYLECASNHAISMQNCPACGIAANGWK